MQIPCQQPEDPGAMGEELDAMRRAAVEHVEVVEPGPDSEAAFLAAGLEVHRLMRPAFGPANAALFNERGRLLDGLADRLGLDPTVRETVDSLCLDEFVHDLDDLLAVAADRGLTATRRAVNRAALMWSPAPGYEIKVIDSSTTTMHQPPYAGTAAGPDASALPMAPCVTLFVFPLIAGDASVNMMRREQPGMPVFFTGNMVGLTLPEPQSGDVEPSGVTDTMLAGLRDRGKIVEADEESCLSAVTELAGAEAQIRADNGLIFVSGDSPVPDAFRLPMRRAVVWFCLGEESVISLRFSS